MKEHSDSQTSSTVILGPFSWISLGLASGVGALLIGAGTWKMPLTIGLLGLGIAVALSILGGLLDSREPSELVFSVSLCVVFSLISFAWFSDSVRQAVLGVPPDHLPEMALTEAFMVEDSQTAVRACEAILNRTQIDSRLEKLLSERPSEAAPCLTSSRIQKAGRRDNVMRRLVADWSSLLKQGSTAEVCVLARPLAHLSAAQDGGLQELLMVTLRASSPVTQECLTQVVREQVDESSDLEFLSLLGSIDRLDESIARRLQALMSANLATSDPVVNFGKRTDMVVGWTLQLSCRDDLAADPEVFQPVGELLRSRGCGSFEAKNANSIWTRVCNELSDVGVRESYGVGCERTKFWAQVDAIEQASARVAAATRAYSSGSTSEAISEADRLSRKDQLYNELFGFDAQIRSVEDNTNVRPLMRGQIVSDLSRARMLSRQLSREELAAAKEMGTVRSVDELRSRVDEFTDPKNRPPIDRETMERIMESEDLSDRDRDQLRNLLDD